MTWYVVNVEYTTNRASPLKSSWYVITVEIQNRCTYTTTSYASNKLSNQEEKENLTLFPPPQTKNNLWETIVLRILAYVGVLRYVLLGCSLFGGSCGLLLVSVG